MDVDNGTTDDLVVGQGSTSEDGVSETSSKPSVSKKARAVWKFALSLGPSVSLSIRFPALEIMTCCNKDSPIIRRDSMATVQSSQVAKDEGPHTPTKAGHDVVDPVII